MKTKMRKGKLLSAVLSVVMGVSMLPQLAFTSLAAPGQVLSVGNGMSQHKGVSDGFSYEIWIDQTGGSGTMTLGQGATFKAEWSASVSAGNFLARRGLDFGSQKKATDYPYIGLDYEADYRQTGSANGNSRLCVYGWFQNKGMSGVPLVEYYIIEDWVDWVPDAAGKMVTIDGAQYKIFQMDHTGPTINGGSETFKQYFSVRQQKRTSGHITVSDHFKAWADQGWGIGNLYEVALNAEGWQSSGVADITKLNVYTDPSQAGTDNPSTPNVPTTPVEPDANGYYFHSTFESGSDGWAERGETTLTSTGTAASAGSKGLYVDGRADTWQGAGYSLDGAAFKAGNSYSFSTMVMQNASSSEDFKLSLQYSLNGEENYATVAEATGGKGEWVQLANTSYTIPAGATNLLLYVETADSTTSFYMDEAIGAVGGTKIPATGSNTPSTPGTTNPPSQDPAEPSTGSYYFHAPYESGTDGWTARGENTIASSSAAAYAGSKSLYVSDRTESWNGAGYTLSTNAFRPGTAYSFSVMAMQNTAASEDFKLSLQYNDASGETQYATVAEGSGAKGEWVKLANPNFTIPAGSSDLLLYVETAESTNSFYMDEAIGAPRGTIISASGMAGDVNSDGKVSVLDIIALQRWLLGQNVKISAGTADMDGNGTVNAFDLAAVKKYVMNPPDDYVTPPTEPPTQAPTQPPTQAPPAAVPGQWYNTADISWIDTSKPMVALTFDDGPVGTANSATSIRIQNALAENGFHATFFYWGSRINGSNEAEIARAHQLGFEVGNHTMNHQDLTGLGGSGVQKEINDCKSILSRITGRDNFLVRPPYLSVNSTVQSNVGAPLINCAIDSGDWNNASTQQMIDKIKAGVSNGSLDNSIVLMHETYTTTAEAIEYLAPYLKQQGWQIVTVSELFKANGQEMKDGQVYTKAN